jgi:hypothetical protein
MSQPTAATPAVVGASWSRSAASCSVLPNAPDPWLASVCITAPRAPARRLAASSPTAPGGQRSPGCASLHLWAGSPAGSSPTEPKPTAITGWPTNAPAAPTVATPTEPTAPAGPSNPRSERRWPMPADRTGPPVRLRTAVPRLLSISCPAWPKAPLGYESLERRSEASVWLRTDLFTWTFASPYRYLPHAVPAGVGRSREQIVSGLRGSGPVRSRTPPALRCCDQGTGSAGRAPHG